uniref:Uncharacterized protein n=1 Tax=Terrapene triunguis TaxID=2587831 RepID=A0A674K0N8_9SAUR
YSYTVSSPVPWPKANSAELWCTRQGREFKSGDCLAAAPSFITKELQHIADINRCLWHKAHLPDVWGEIGLRTSKVLFAEDLFYLPVSIIY